MNDLPGRGDVNPYGIPVPNPHEQEDPDEEWNEVWAEQEGPDEPGFWLEVFVRSNLLTDDEWKRLDALLKKASPDDG